MPRVAEVDLRDPCAFPPARPPAVPPSAVDGVAARPAVQPPQDSCDGVEPQRPALAGDRRDSGSGRHVEVAAAGAHLDVGEHWRVAAAVVYRDSDTVRGVAVRAPDTFGDVDEPLGWRPTTLAVTIRRYRCAECSHVWRQGRGTFVCAIADYTVTVTIAAPADSPAVPGARLSGDPSVAALRFDERGDEWQWRTAVRAADAGRAAVSGLAAARRVSPPGVDFMAASVRSEAAE